VARVRGAKADRQTEGLARLAVLEEFERLPAEAGGGVGPRRVVLVEERPGLPGEALPVVEVLGHRLDVRADPELADEARAVARLPQKRRVRLRPRFGLEGLLKIVDAVPPLVLSRQDRRAADAADRGGDEAVFEEDAVAREPVD